MKKFLSIFLAVLMVFGMATPQSVFAATTGTTYNTHFPRPTDDISNEGWGRPALKLINGWDVYAMDEWCCHTVDAFGTEICYCIEPGVNRTAGRTITQYDESSAKFAEIADMNPLIDADKLTQFWGRIMEYGYAGKEKGWRHAYKNMDELCTVIATQLLIWEASIGERDANFNLVSVPAGTANLLLE